MPPVTTQAAARKAEGSPADRLYAALAQDMERVDRLIHERMTSTAALIPELGRHIVDSGGKRLRPLITIAAARLCNIKGAHHIGLATAVEFIHTATLLHDDVVDESGLRRGRPTANIVWGNKPSVLVGDFLFSRAFELMVETGNIRVLDILARASAVIAEGEVMQLKYTKNLATAEEDYLAVIGAKTAALFAAAAEAGAIAAGAEPSVARAFRDYGRNLGIAFQLADDALDYDGREAVMGKTVGDDFRESKVTLPLILSYARADEAERAFWLRTIELGTQGSEDLSRAIAYLDESGAIDETRARARRYAVAACRALTACPAGELREMLAQLAEFCADRAY